MIAGPGSYLARLPRGGGIWCDLGLTGSVLRGSSTYNTGQGAVLIRTLFDNEKRELQGGDPVENCPMAKRCGAG